MLRQVLTIASKILRHFVCQIVVTSSCLTKKSLWIGHTRKCSGENLASQITLFSSLIFRKGSEHMGQQVGVKVVEE